MRFLEEKRTWLEQDVRKANDSLESLEFIGQEQDDKVQRALKMLDTVDTALLKSYMLIGGPQVGALLRNVNYCNMEETENLLLKHKVSTTYMVFPVIAEVSTHLLNIKLTSFHLFSTEEQRTSRLLQGQGPAP
jgi:hypothetical protein